MEKFPDYKTAKVDSLIPYARNSRTHSDAQVDKIAASIKEFGFLNPVIVDGDNGIIAGHGRLLAAKKLGMDEVPTVEASHLTDAQRRAYVIADNRIALDADWDDEMLAVEFEELKSVNFNMTLLGWGETLPEFLDGPDYSILENEDIESELSEMSSNVRKAIQIEFEQEHYEEARDLVKWWREQGAYVGIMLLNHLKQEMEKHENNQS